MTFQRLVHKKLAAAVATAIVAAAGTWVSIEQQQKKMTRATHMTTLLRAKKFVAGGKSVAPEAVEEVLVPDAAAPPAAVRKKSDLVDAQGRPRYKARVGFSKGEIVTPALLAEPASFGGLAWVLEPGAVAFALRLNPEDAVAGLVQPGDFVRVFSTAGGVSRVALARARVAAVNDRIWDPSVPPAPSEISKTMAVEPVLITLMGTPDEALRLWQAVMGGGVGLALCSPLADTASGGE